LNRFIVAALFEIRSSDTQSREMLVVETIGRIRREHLVKSKSIKEIARVVKISRNYGPQDPALERNFVFLRARCSAPATARPVEGRSGLLSEGERRHLGAWLSDPDPSVRRLAGAGLRGRYDAVRRYARTWIREHASQTAAAFVAPGEAYQFDWRHEIVLVSGVTVTVKIAHMRLCHSRMIFWRAHPHETQEMVFDAHERAFAFCRGAWTRGIYDNTKTAVETIFIGNDRK
jgi:transposase